MVNILVKCTPAKKYNRLILLPRVFIVIKYAIQQLAEIRGPKIREMGFLEGIRAVDFSAARH